MQGPAGCCCTLQGSAGCCCALQGSAGCCGVLQRVAGFFGVLQGLAGFCRVLLGTARCCGVLQSVAGFRRLLWGSMGCCRVLQGVAGPYKAVQGVAGCFWVLQGSAGCCWVFWVFCSGFCVCSLWFFSAGVHSRVCVEFEETLLPPSTAGRSSDPAPLCLCLAGLQCMEDVWKAGLDSVDEKEEGSCALRSGCSTAVLPPERRLSHW